MVENLAGRLRESGVESWVYSVDKTLGNDSWAEIIERIHTSRIFIFVASEHSINATGQHRELEIALDRVRQENTPPQFLPIVIDQVRFESLPEALRCINGLRLDTYTIKSTAQEIARRFFPELSTAEKSRDWKYPRPGQWLEVCNLDPWIEEKFDIGDQVYFRRISPLGLFECFSPKLKGLFWFASHNLRISDTLDEDGKLERQIVPRSFRYDASYDFERIGIEEMRKKGKLEQ